VERYGLRRGALQRVGDVLLLTSPRLPKDLACSSRRRAAISFNAQATHARGRLHPFEADITDQVSAGDEARVTVMVNNTLSFQSIPPGVVEDIPAGKRQRYWHDFFDYAAIHRSVRA
jgi:beta-glucuronidase